MPEDFHKFFASESSLSVTQTGATAVRTGFRRILSDQAGNIKLSKYLAGQLPYYYRKIESLVEDFESQHDALESLLDMMAAAPDSPSFRNSHAGEILACRFVETRLGLSRLYSKLTMTTSQNTNAHKMDGLFVNTTKSPFEYVFVEAKSSILPTAKTPTKIHRHGVLKAMLESLDGYAAQEPRMEYVRIRENLSTLFKEKVASQIRADLRMPGPTLNYLGISVTNTVTVNEDDDDFMLLTPSSVPFDYHALVVTNMEKLAADSYGMWDGIKAVIK